jgi:hypothetical protein
MNINDCLSMIAKRFLEEKIRYVVGGSYLLHQYKLEDNVNDLDLVIHPKDIFKALSIMDTLGEQLETQNNPIYESTHFHKYDVDGVSVDIISDLIINYQNFQYHYVLDGTKPHESIIVNGVQVFLADLEDWYVIYLFIGNRRQKVEKLEKYIIEKGTLSQSILHPMLDKSIPEEFKVKIKNLFKRK